MAALIIIRVTRDGLHPPEIQASNEADEKAAEEILSRIRPCLDVADAIIKKGNPGPKG